MGSGIKKISPRNLVGGRAITAFSNPLPPPSLPPSLLPSLFRVYFQWGADTFKSEKLEDAAEFGRIGRYYALEDMLTTDPSEKYGRTTLREHYERVAKDRD